MNINFINNFRGLSAGQKAVALAETLAFIVVAFIMMVPDEARAQSGNVYGNGQAQVFSQTDEAVVLQTRIKAAEPSWQTRTTGAGVGAVLGGLLGRQASSNNAVSIIAGTLGALAGERVSNAVMTNAAQEIVLQVFGRGGMPPRIITIVQPAPFDKIAAGEHVFLVNSAGTYRVVKKMQQSVAYLR